MSEIENVSKKILDDAKKQSDAILESAEKKAREILKEAEEQRAKTMSEAKKEASEKYGQVYDMEISKNKAQMEQQILLAKLELVESVIEKAKKSLKDVDAKKYVSYINNKLNSLDISKGVYLIGRNEKVLDHDMLKPLMEQINVKKADEKPDFEEGLKIFSGNAQYSISLLNAVEVVKEDLMIEIASYIFDKEK
jgi:V/A-type H+/Na+-transporting ATPase subunit E